MTSNYLGREVDATPAAWPDSTTPLKGSYVTLEGFRESHVPSLWQNLQIETHAYLYDYLPWTAPASQEELRDAICDLIAQRGFVVYCIKADPERVGPGQSGTGHAAHSQVLGIICYLEIQPVHRALEVGGVLFGPLLARTTAATEVHYLMLRNVFERSSSGLDPEFLPYRRVCWKNNALNKKSRRAAERLGYLYEGTFRNHYIFNGRSRDSNWLSIVDDEWPVVKAALEQWLLGANFDENGKQVRTLEEIREDLKRTAGS